MKRVVVALPLLALLIVSGCGDDEPAKPLVDVPSWATVAPEQITEARRHGVPVAFENGLGMRFVLIPAGAFQMGSPESERGRDSDEKQHEVTLTKSYYMQITEVTNAQYRRLKRDHDSGKYTINRREHSLNGDSQPVVEVSWEDAQAFVQWLNRQESGRSYRLPTEAEWERAARTSTGTRFSFGDRDKDLARYGNYADKNTAFEGSDNGADDGHAVTAPVASFGPNPWGLYDMHGNVWEWVQDWYDTGYAPERVRDPAGPSTGESRVARGGSWANDPWSARSADRGGFTPSSRYDSFGFRLVSPVEP